MTARASMTDLIAQLRLLANDPAGETAVFTDLQLQNILDKHAYQAMYERLDEIQNVAPGGVVEYKKYRSTHGFWESDVALTDGNYRILTPETSNLQTGLWTFTASTPPPVLVYGVWYDMNGAAANVWELWATKFAQQFDTSVDGANYSLSQKQAQALEQANKFRRDAVGYSGVTHLRRSDVTD